MPVFAENVKSGSARGTPACMQLLLASLTLSLLTGGWRVAAMDDHLLPGDCGTPDGRTPSHRCAGELQSWRSPSLSPAPGALGPASTTDAAIPAVVPAKRPARLQCLDAVRGLNVMLMVLVDDVGSWFQQWVDHSPWGVIHLADFVMPLFLFMVRCGPPR